MTNKMIDQNTIPKQTMKYWVSVTLIYLFIPVVLIIFGWDLKWWQAWVYSVLIIVFGIGGRALAEKRHPGLILERSRMEKGENVKGWDKVIGQLVAFSVSFPLYIVAGLDHRYGWSPTFPIWLNILGLMLITIGYTFAGWALLENRFFSSMVRIQKDRGHVVCDTGPYRIMRHPGYAGNILPLFGIVMALSSTWTLIPVAVAMILVVIRTALEDKTLQEELPGYREYTQRVHYRLLPGVW